MRPTDNRDYVNSADDQGALVRPTRTIDDTRGWTAVGAVRNLPATDAVDTYSITSGLYNFIKIVVSGTSTIASATVTFDWSGKHRSM